MNNLVKVNNILLNPSVFAGFEFSDEDMCMWAYDVNFEYQSFYIDSESEYTALKKYINGLVASTSTVKPPAPFEVSPPKSYRSHKIKVR